MPSFSIGRLMTVIVLIGMGLAAARAGAFAFAVLVLAGMTVAELLLPKSRRVGCVGAAATGWTYLLLAFGLGLDVRNCLPTTRWTILTYEWTHSPFQTVYPTQEAAQQAITDLYAVVSDALTVGHSLFALGLALVSGLVVALFNQRGSRFWGRAA